MSTVISSFSFIFLSNFLRLCEAELLIQSNLAIRNFLVTLKLFLNAKFLWSKWQIGHRKWFLNTNLFLIEWFLITKYIHHSTHGSTISQISILNWWKTLFFLFNSTFCRQTENIFLQSRTFSMINETHSDFCDQYICSAVESIKIFMLLYKGFHPIVNTSAPAPVREAKFD